MRQAAPEIDGARVERDRRCLNGLLERATIWNEDKWISSNASVFVHCIYSCAIMLHFCSRNCNSLKEESAGKTAEVAFFLLYRKQLEIAGIGIKHIRACSLDVFLLDSDFLIPQGCLKCNKEANRTENKFCARLPSMTQVHGPKKETCFWPGPKRWYQYQYIHMLCICPKLGKSCWRPSAPPVAEVDLNLYLRLGLQSDMLPGSRLATVAEIILYRQSEDPQEAKARTRFVIHSWVLRYLLCVLYFCSILLAFYSFLF